MYPKTLKNLELFSAPNTKIFFLGGGGELHRFADRWQVGAGVIYIPCSKNVSTTSVLSCMGSVPNACYFGNPCMLNINVWAVTIGSIKAWNVSGCGSFPAQSEIHCFVCCKQAIESAWVFSRNSAWCDTRRSVYSFRSPSAYLIGKEGNLLHNLGSPTDIQISWL
jgi:hypothetical protein